MIFFGFYQEKNKKEADPKSHTSRSFKFLKMKRFVIVSILTSFLLAGTPVWAQKVGVKGGLNFTNLTNLDSNLDDPNMRTGFHLGGFVSMPITKQIALRPELYYIQKGSSFTANILGGAAEFTNKVDYLELPVLIDVEVMGPIHFQMGPYFSYLLNAGYDFSWLGTSTEGDINKSDLNPLEVGAAVGLSFHLENLEVGARYGMGLTKLGLDQKIGDFTIEASETKNQSFILSVGFRLAGL